MAKEGMESNQIIIYKTPDGAKRVEVRLEDENVWLSQKLMAVFFGVGVPTINEHLSNIFKTRELEENSTIRKFRIVQKEGNRGVEREIEFYSLDAIIAVGYRVNSERGVIFRQWATEPIFF